MKAAGLEPLDREIGALCNVDATTVWRVRTGKRSPSDRMIAGLLSAFPRASFYDLFVVNVAPAT